MQPIFKKSNLEQLKYTLHNHDAGSEQWILWRKLNTGENFQHQLSTEIMLLQRGAYAGETWSMCQLAREYYNNCGDVFLPHALSWWKRAAERNDEGAIWDLNNLNILDRILKYNVMPDEYANIEMKCAMLAEWYLTDLGRINWHSLEVWQREQRCKQLCQAACDVLGIGQIDVSFVSNLYFEGYEIVDGLAHQGKKGAIEVRLEMTDDFERLIEVIFHELGHHVTFEIRSGSSKSQRLKEIYHITDERAALWNTDQIGYSEKISEEDPDTLSYGVYTQWATFFANGD